MMAPSRRMKIHGLFEAATNDTNGFCHTWLGFSRGLNRRQGYIFVERVAATGI
jgi:hypothetical protein